MNELYIKDEEMPKCCNDCPLQQYDGHGDFHCYIDGGKEMYDGVAKGVCPLRPLSEAAGECEAIPFDNVYGVESCSECCCYWDDIALGGDHIKSTYCPNCGRKIKRSEK
jgi:hypothetical protein